MTQQNMQRRCNTDIPNDKVVAERLPKRLVQSRVVPEPALTEIMAELIVLQDAVSKDPSDVFMVAALAHKQQQRDKINSMLAKVIIL